MSGVLLKNITISMNFNPNGLFYKMADFFSSNRDKGKVIICNEGGSRSSKTWDAMHFIYAICDHNPNKGLDIYILRETLIKCRDFTLKDFTDVLKLIGDYDPNALIKSPKPYYNLKGNNVYFRGLEDEENSEGYPSDILFFNETLEMRKTQIDGLKMRCRMLMICDWNPKFTTHWAFDLENGKNTLFTRSNYKNNPKLQESIVEELSSYNPFEEGHCYIENHKLMYNGAEVSDTNSPPPNIENINRNTADLYRYKVYTLGLRGVMKGLIFQNVSYIEEFPDIAHTYGLDFGFTADPTALVKYAQQGDNIYLELLSYAPMETESVICDYLDKIGVEKLTPITADSADRYVSADKGVQDMVTAIRRKGYSCTKVRKIKSVMYWLLEMKKLKIHIVINNFSKFAKIEAENYRFKEVNGIEINQPEDAHNHFWDASRYAFMSYNSKSSIWG